MDLRAAILKEHSRAQSTRIADWVGDDPQRVSQLMQLFLHDEYRVVQRAAWILSIVAHSHPGVLAPHLAAMVQRMSDVGVPVAVKRNVARVLQFLPIPVALHDAVMHQCFVLLEDVEETVAVRCFAMTVLSRLAVDYPDIGRSIRLLIEEEFRHSPSPAFRSRAKKVLGQLNAE